MKDMDKYWKSVGSLFDSKDNRKVIWIGYAVGLVLVTAWGCNLNCVKACS